MEVGSDIDSGSDVGPAGPGVLHVDSDSDVERLGLPGPGVAFAPPVPNRVLAVVLAELAPPPSPVLLST